jgi:hypothetical protein
MPLMPEDALPSEETLLPEEPPARPSPRRWQSRLLRICFAIFTFEVGIFLVIFPWTDTWDLNSIQRLIPTLRDFWSDPYFRGAVTGLGVVNLYVACLEVGRLLRRSSQ